METSPKRSYFKFDFRIFSILMLLAAVPLLVGSWLIFHSYEALHLERAGINMAESADMAFNALSGYLQEKIISVATLTEIPILRAIVYEGNRNLGRSLEDTRQAIPEMESKWGTLESQDPQLKVILDNPASRFLRQYASVATTYREIMVTDYLGRLVAATGKTSDYYQADEEWWKETFGDGRRGSVYVGNVKYDESVKVYSMELAQPFVEPGEGVIGVVKVVLDVQDLHRLLNQLPAGPFVTASLIRADGTVISAHGYSILDQTPFPDLTQIQEAIGRKRRHFISSSEPKTLYGLTLNQFADLYPHLDWILVMRGNVGDVLGPLPQHRVYFIVLLLVTILFTFLATMLLSRVRSKPALEQDPHLESL